LRDYLVDEELFERLVDANKRRIMWIARSYAPWDSVEDLYQEILFEIWMGLPGFRGLAKIETWIYRVALNTAMNFREKACRRKIGYEIREEAFRYEAARPDARSETAILSEFIHSLDDTDRLLFLMYLDDGFSSADMAEATGLKEPNVRVRISRLKKSYIERYIRTR
jgi:RNA polymerase sigma-70 factor (ECF subfamily)